MKRPAVDELMFHCAFRYCLTRHSYVTGAAVDWVRGLWSELSPGARSVLVRDLRQHIEEWGARDMEHETTAIDMRGWVDLLAWCEAQDKQTGASQSS